MPTTCAGLFEGKDEPGEEHKSESDLRITFFHPYGHLYPMRVEEGGEVIATRFYALSFFSTPLSSTALVATVIELALMANAPTAGASKMPKG